MVANGMRFGGFVIPAKVGTMLCAVKVMAKVKRCALRYPVNLPRIYFGKLGITNFEVLLYGRFCFL